MECRYRLTGEYTNIEPDLFWTKTPPSDLNHATRINDWHVEHKQLELERQSEDAVLWKQDACQRQQRSWRHSLRDIPADACMTQGRDSHHCVVPGVCAPLPEGPLFPSTDRKTPGRKNNATHDKLCSVYSAVLGLGETYGTHTAVVSTRMWPTG